MLIIMQHGADEAHVTHVINRVEKMGLRAHVSAGEFVTVIGVIGDERALIADSSIAAAPGVDRVVPIMRPYKLISREFRGDQVVLDIAGVRVGGEDFLLIAGPCAVESREQTFAAAGAVADAGAAMLRGGAFKPRTNPDAFQGLGKEGLRILAEAKAMTGLPVVTEAMDIAQLEEVAEVADVIQIGARNMQNFDLLKAAGRTGCAVLLKRGLAATIEEWLLAAEYIAREGNEKIMLCERGIRTFEPATRGTLDLSAVAVAKQQTGLPVIVDPSHAAGRPELIGPLGRAAAAVGADGLIVEVHPDPESALCDGPQALRADGFAAWVSDVERIVHAMGRRLSQAAARYSRRP